MRCVLVACREQSERKWLDLGDNLTPNSGYVFSQFREMVVIKFKCHGINFGSLVGLMFLISVLHSPILTWKELSCVDIVVHGVSGAQFQGHQRQGSPTGSAPPPGMSDEWSVMCRS